MQSKSIPMFKRLLLLLIFLYPGFLLAQTDDAPRDTTLRVLSIGNSFSIDANLILPQVVVDAGVPRDNFELLLMLLCYFYYDYL